VERLGTIILSAGSTFARAVLWTVLAGIALSAGVGLLAGYWPARSASNLPVVEALRSE
jgi:ABC-type lipoprotein release transport system permease subunit